MRVTPNVRLRCSGRYEIPQRSVVLGLFDRGFRVFDPSATLYQLYQLPRNFCARSNQVTANLLVKKSQCLCHGQRGGHEAP